MSTREAFLWIVEQFVGSIYVWGGDDFLGVDCSGLWNYSLQSVGRLPWKGDWTADGALQLGKARGWEVKEPDIRAGCGVFFLNDHGHAIHVEIIWRRPLLAIGASGGGRANRLSEEERRLPAHEQEALLRLRAKERNAFVRIAPWRRREGPYAFLDPFRELEVERRE